MSIHQFSPELHRIDSDDAIDIRSSEPECSSSLIDGSIFTPLELLELFGISPLPSADKLATDLIQYEIMQINYILLNDMDCQQPQVDTLPVMHVRQDSSNTIFNTLTREAIAPLSDNQNCQNELSQYQVCSFLSSLCTFVKYRMSIIRRGIGQTMKRWAY